MKHLHGLDIPVTLEDVCDPQRMALLVYDMQAGICSQIAAGDRIVARTLEAVSAARARACGSSLHATCRSRRPGWGRRSSGLR